MRLLSIFFLCFHIGVFAELSSNSCSLLRTVTSITTIIPEIAQLAIRYYRTSDTQHHHHHHHREKRFLFGESSSKDPSGAAKGSVIEKMVANAFKDVDFTKVALLILNNNESIAKIRQNVDGDVIIRAIMRKIDYEKLGSTLWYSTEAEFDLEHFVASIINITQIDIIHEELIANGTLPDWFIQSIHPNLNPQIIHRMFATIKNLTQKFGRIMSSSDQLDDYLFSMIQKQALTPLGNIIQRIKDDKPTTLDQLVEIILNDVNQIVMEQFTTTTKQTASKKAQGLTTTMAPLDESMDGDVKLLLYQCSIAIDSIGQTARILLQAIEQLYCTSLWE